MSAIAKALADVSRSYVSAKASVADTTAAMLAHGPAGGYLTYRPDLAHGQEQLRHYRGWPYAAIRAIAQKIAAQPLCVGRKRAMRRAGTKQYEADKLTSHALLDLFADPSDLLTRWALMYTTVASLQLTGRGLWWLPGRKQILPIPVSWLVGFEGSTRFTSFKVRPPHTGEEFTLPAEECCYFALPNPADPHGATGPLQAAAHAVTVDEEIQTSQVSAFRRGIHPSHAVIVGKQPHSEMPGGLRPHLTAAQQRQIIGAIRKRYEGVHNHGEPIILDGLIDDIKRLSNTPEEMNWLGSGQAVKERILQTFGVNEIIIGSKEANRASATAAEKHFVDFTVNPLIELMSQALTEWLRPQFGNDLVIWIEPCVPHDAEMQLKKIGLAAQHGVITADELRDYAGLPQHPAFADQLVGGQDMATTSPIEAGIRAIVLDAMGETDANVLLAHARELNGA